MTSSCEFRVNFEKMQHIKFRIIIVKFENLTLCKTFSKVANRYWTFSITVGYLARTVFNRFPINIWPMQKPANWFVMLHNRFLSNRTFFFYQFVSSLSSRKKRPSILKPLQEAQKMLRTSKNEMPPRHFRGLSKWREKTLSLS